MTSNDQEYQASTEIVTTARERADGRWNQDGWRTTMTEARRGCCSCNENEFSSLAWICCRLHFCCSTDYSHAQRDSLTTTKPLLPPQFLDWAVGHALQGRLYCKLPLSPPHFLFFGQSSSVLRPTRPHLPTIHLPVTCCGLPVLLRVSGPQCNV